MFVLHWLNFRKLIGNLGKSLSHRGNIWETAFDGTTRDVKCISVTVFDIWVWDSHSRSEGKIEQMRTACQLWAVHSCAGHCFSHYSQLHCVGPGDRLGSAAWQFSAHPGLHQGVRDNVASRSRIINLQCCCWLKLYGTPSLNGRIKFCIACGWEMGTRE